MIINDLHLRFGLNKQETGAGTTKFDTRYNIYTINSTDATNGYFSSMVLPCQPFNTIIEFECEVRLVSASAGLAELHMHSSPYYGASFKVADQHKITSTKWSLIKLKYITFAKADEVYPRLSLGVDDTSGTIEFRNMSLTTRSNGDIKVNEIDRKLRSKNIGPDFQTTQGITTTTTGSGSAVYDVSGSNYTEFIATGSDTAFITIDDFAGFERNLNTEYYVIEIDALVPVQAGECVAKFAFRDSGSGDIFYNCKLTQTIENAAGSSETYQTYKFWIVQDGSPSTIDSVELEVGAMVGFPSTCRIREIRLRSYGLTTGNLKQINIQASACLERVSGTWAFDETFRREGFNAVSESGANTIRLTMAYRTGKLPVLHVGSLTNLLINPVITAVSIAGVLPTIDVVFKDSSGVVIALSALTNGDKLLIGGIS